MTKEALYITAICLSAFMAGVFLIYAWDTGAWWAWVGAWVAISVPIGCFIGAALKGRSIKWEMDGE